MKAGKNAFAKVAGVVLFVVYMLLLSWIILFKANPGTFDVMFDPDFRSVSFELYFNSRETLMNVVAFGPLGVYLSLLIKNASVKRQIAIQVMLVICVSLFYEVMQYILAVGTSDITDIISNTLGGILGITGYRILCFVKKDDAENICWAVSCFATVAMYVVMKLYY